MVKFPNGRTGPVLLVLTAILLGGCRRADEPATATGTVTVDGKPVSGIVVTVQPESGTKGPKATAPVVNGRFSFGREAGLRGGTYRVRFTVMPPNLLSQLPPKASEGVVAPGVSIAPEYDLKSKLTWDVKPGSENTSTFEIKFQ